jgi:serine/threonine protein kinase
MEYCAFGDLADKVERYKKRRQYIDEKVIFAYLIQALEALSNLHSKRICHRDLKPANCFLCDDGTIKIGDMNVSKRMKHGLLKTQIGTPYYMSPEIWSNQPYNESSDMWALGCLTYELAALTPPFLGDSFPLLKRAVLSGRYKSIPRTYSYELSTVISKLLRVNPRSRPSAKDLLASPEVLKFMKPGGYGKISPSTDHQMDLMATIKVPHGPKRRISSVLPKPCYPDNRPNSPKSWPVSARDRKEAIEKKENASGGGVNGMRAIGENDDENENAAPKQAIPASPMPIRANSGAADILKSARNHNNIGTKQRSNQQQPQQKQYRSKDTEASSQGQRRALAPLGTNNSNNVNAGPPRDNLSQNKNYGARPGAGSRYSTASKQKKDMENKPSRPDYRSAAANNGRRPVAGNVKAGGHRQAGSVYGGGGAPASAVGGAGNYRRGQYSYKPSWWG